MQGKENIFVAMPSYKIKQKDGQGKDIYQDVCYPVTKEFREKLYDEILNEYEIAKERSQEKAKEDAGEKVSPDKAQERGTTPFR